MIGTTEEAIDRSVTYRGYHLEHLENKTIVRRFISPAKFTKDGWTPAIIYHIGEYPDANAAVEAIDNAARKWGEI